MDEADAGADPLNPMQELGAITEETDMELAGLGRTKGVATFRRSIPKDVVTAQTGVPEGLTNGGTNQTMHNQDIPVPAVDAPKQAAVLNEAPAADANIPVVVASSPPDEVHGPDQLHSEPARTSQVVPTIEAVEQPKVSEKALETSPNLQASNENDSNVPPNVLEGIHHQGTFRDF